MMTPELYLSLMTMHGTIMVFFVLTTAPQSGFGNYFLPIQIGAEDMAFPVLNMLSFWTTFVALVVMVSAFFVTGGAPLAGWTAYPPLSALGRDRRARARHGPDAVDHRHRDLLRRVADGRAQLHRHHRRPALQGHDADAHAADLLDLAGHRDSRPARLRRAAGRRHPAAARPHRRAPASSFPAAWWSAITIITNHKGGSPLLWQHLFWFFGHPEVYIAILPGMGVASHIALHVLAQAGVRLQGDGRTPCCASASWASCVWGHHMFMSGMSPYSAFAFSVLTMTIGVPSAIKTFNWLGTLWGGKIQFTTAMLFALGFVSLFVTGGLSGIFLGQPALDLYFHDTYFVVGALPHDHGRGGDLRHVRRHLLLVPEDVRPDDERDARQDPLLLTFIGVYCIFMPMHFLGLAGNPRRYSDFTNVEYLASLLPVHEFITYAAYFTTAAQIIFLFNLFWSMKKGPKAPRIPGSHHARMDHSFAAAVR